MFCGCVWKSFCGRVVQSLSQCHTSPMLLPRSLWRVWCRCCRPAVFVSENVNHASIFGSVSSQSTQRLVEQLFPFCLARLVDKTAWTHLAAAHETFLYPFAFGCRLSTTFIHDFAQLLPISLAIDVSHCLRMNTVLSKC